MLGEVLRAFSAVIGFAVLRSQRWTSYAWKHLSVQVTILLMVGLFAGALGVDSLIHSANAESISSVETEIVAMSLSASVSAEPTLKHHGTPVETYLEYDSETAKRLRTSALTAARFTGGRLTEAHLFTEQVH